MSTDIDDGSAHDLVRRSGARADRMEDRLEVLGEHIDEASKRAEVTRDHATASHDETASGEMQAPAVSSEPDDEDAADPGDPLADVVGDDDVAPA